MTLGNQGNVRAVCLSSTSIIHKTDEHHTKALDDAASAVQKKLKNNPRCPVPEPEIGFILVVLPQNAAVLRKEVKQWSDMIAGIPTQCVVGTSS